MLFFKNKKKKEIERQKALIGALAEINLLETFEPDNIDLLVDVVKRIRPSSLSKVKSAESQMTLLVEQLEGNPALLAKFRSLLAVLLDETKIAEVLTESGLVEGSSFFSELQKRINYKFLPPLKRKGSFIYIVDTLFYKTNDYKWVSEMSNSLWEKLFDLLGMEIDVTDKEMRHQLSESLNVISFRIAALGLEKELSRYFDGSLNPEPFIKQNRIVQAWLTEKFDETKYMDFEYRLLEQLCACETIIDTIKKRSIEEGTSINQTHILMRLQQYISRVKLTLDISGQDEKIEYERAVLLFKRVVEDENTKYGVMVYLKESMQFLAYRITEHERNTGEHYITETKTEYNSMLKSAFGGGFIISFVAVIKNLWHHVAMPSFWQNFVYSLNYSFGFIFIHMTGSTLATKQPAMTASAIASTLDKRSDKRLNLAELAILTSQVSRSQIASFFGNLVVVFPLSMLIAFLLSWLFNIELADPVWAKQLIDQQNPLKYATIVYASIAGIFLFLAGIISGYFDNLVIYGKISERLKEQPFLKRTLSPKLLNKLANYLGKNTGAIMGNLILGFLLGMAAFFGYIFGLPIDIRHVTISMANLAIGIFGSGFTVPLPDLLMASFGVVLIGFFNFLVSFTLAFFVALLSRGIRFSKYRSFGVYLWRLFKTYPRDFLLPPAKKRVPEDFLPQRKSTDSEEVC